ncbi:MAG: FKBP-type peptidyl-prolyl cis-trans isomerase [Candidatus Thorarchaeota archaeon]
MSDDKTKKKSETKKTTEKKTKKSTTSKKVTDTVESGSLIYVDYVGRSKEDGKIFDLTMEEVAKEEGLYKEDGYYAPVLVVIGWSWLLEAIEEELVGMKIGESKTIEVPPEKGAGPRDPAKVKQIAKAKLARQRVSGHVGEEIKFGEERGVITHVFGRTVRVDFNPPLAGKTLVFDVTVRQIITDLEEKIYSVVKRRIPILSREEVGITIKSKIITIELPLRTRYIESVQYAEIGIAMDALKVHEKADEVKLVVSWKRPEPPTDNTTA